MAANKERTPTWPVERDLLELDAEALALQIPQERAQAKAERRQVAYGNLAQEQRREALATVPDFWGTVYGDTNGILALFSGTRSEKSLTDPRSAYFRWPADTPQALHWLADQADAERELYQCAHLLTRPPRRKENAAPLASLYVDLDHDQLADQVPTPTVIIESSPGRLQAYWRLTSPVPPAAGEILNRRLAHTLGADKTGWDLTQLLRIPATTNHKYPDQPTVKVLLHTDRAYDVETVENTLADLPPLRGLTAPPRPVEAYPTEPNGARPPASLSAAARKVWEGETVKRKEDGSVDRSAALIQIARVLYEHGMSRPLLVAALQERDASLGWKKYSGRRDAQRQYEAVAELVERGARTQHRQ